MSREEAAKVIYDNLGAIPCEKVGVINLLPWAAEDEETNSYQRLIADGLAGVLESAGQLAKDQPGGLPERSIKLHCRSCSTVLLTVSTDHSGVANVPAASIITALGSMNAACPHDRKTLEDQRRFIEQALEEMRNE